MFSLRWNHSTFNETLDISNSIFINCVDTNGGAIYANNEFEKIVSYCTFYLCNATGTTGSRGGAFFLEGEKAPPFVFSGSSRTRTDACKKAVHGLAQKKKRKIRHDSCRSAQSYLLFTCQGFGP